MRVDVFFECNYFIGTIFRYHKSLYLLVRVLTRIGPNTILYLRHSVTREGNKMSGTLKNFMPRTQAFNFAATTVNPVLLTCPTGFHIWIIGLWISAFSSIAGTNTFQDVAGTVTVFVATSETADSAKIICDWVARGEGIRLTNNSSFRNTTAGSFAGSGFVEYFFEAN